MLYGRAKTIEVDGHLRKYRLSISKVRRPRGLIVALHGLGYDGRAIAYYSGLHNVARRHRLAVVYPDALDKKGVARGWNAGFCCGSGWKHNHNDEQFLLELVRQLRKKYGIPKKVFFTGFSNGGIMTHVMAANHPREITAAAVVAGAVGSDKVYVKPKKPIPIMLVHGTKDLLVSFEGGRSRSSRFYWQPFSKSVEVWQKANKNKAVVEAITFPIGHRWPDLRLLKFWRRRPKFSRRLVQFFVNQL